MGARLVFDFERVFRFVAARSPGMHFASDMVGIGLERDGDVVAGVLYEGHSGTNMFMHVAAQPGARWMNRDYLKACFVYPFTQLGCRRVSGWVNESNAAARRFDEHLGFKEEARLKGAAPDGGDVILYVMWKEDCRFIGRKEVQSC